MIRLLHHCGLPLEDLDFINCDGKTMNKFLMEVNLYLSAVSSFSLKVLFPQPYFDHFIITNFFHHADIIYVCVYIL